MRQLFTAAAISSLAIFASSSFAALTVSSTRTAINATQDRVVLFGLSDVASDGLLAADIRIRSIGANMFFSAPVIDLDADTQTINVKRSNPNTVVFTSAATNVFFTQVGTTTPDNGSTSAGTPPALAAGTNDFGIVGFDGRPPVRGTPAGATVNGGLGAAFFAAVVPTGTPVRFSGQLAAESGFIVGPFDFTNGGGGPVNSPPVIGAVPTTVVNFGNLAAPRPFSVDISTTDANAADVLALTLGALPAGIFGVSVVGGGTSPEVFTVAGFVSGTLIGSTVAVPFSVSDGTVLTSGSFSIQAIPEPTTLAALSMVGLVALRRRK